MGKKLSQTGLGDRLLRLKATFHSFFPSGVNLHCRHDLIFPKHISKGLAELLPEVGEHERGYTERTTVLGSIFL